MSSGETLNLSMILQIYFALMKSSRGEEKLRRFSFKLVIMFNKVVLFALVWFIKSIFMSETQFILKLLFIYRLTYFAFGSRNEHYFLTECQMLTYNSKIMTHSCNVRLLCSNLIVRSNLTTSDYNVIYAKLNKILTLLINTLPKLEFLLIILLRYFAHSFYVSANFTCIGSFFHFYGALNFRSMLLRIRRCDRKNR